VQSNEVRSNKLDEELSAVGIDILTIDESRMNELRRVVLSMKSRGSCTDPRGAPVDRSTIIQRIGYDSLFNAWLYIGTVSNDQ